MKNVRDTSWINHLGRQLNQGKQNKLLESAYMDCLQHPYAHLFIDLSNEQEQSNCRVRTGIFPEDCTIYMKDDLHAP